MNKMLVDIYKVVHKVCQRGTKQEFSASLKDVLLRALSSKEPNFEIWGKTFWTFSSPPKAFEKI